MMLVRDKLLMDADAEIDKDTNRRPLYYSNKPLSIKDTISKKILRVEAPALLQTCVVVIFYVDVTYSEMRSTIHSSRSLYVSMDFLIHDVIGLDMMMSEGVNEHPIDRWSTA